MMLDSIDKLLRRCDATELEEVLEIAQRLLDEIKQAGPPSGEEDARQRRREARFETNLLATLTRVTDVKPGERKEYSVTVRDVSRSGMKLIMDSNFIPSRVVEVTFATPGGKIKRSMLEVVRLRKMVNADGSWLEVGCRSISDEYARRIRLQEEKIARLRGKLHKKSQILVLVVGPETPAATTLVTQVKAASYQTRHITGLRQALESAERTAAQLAIFVQGSEIARDANLLAELDAAPKTLAMLAFVETEEDRFPLLHAGVDEVVTTAGAVRDELLSHCIERALIGHVVRQQDRRTPLARALIVSSDGTKVNLVSYQLEEHGFKCTTAADRTQAQLLKPDDKFDLIMADFDAVNPGEFQELVKHFAGAPVVALCNHIGYGREAMTLGACNYLCMPPSDEEIRLILDSLLASAPDAV